MSENHSVCPVIIKYIIYKKSKLFKPPCLIGFDNNAISQNTQSCSSVNLCNLLCVCVPVYKAFALQISQCRAELVGEQNERGQIQIVLPDLKERTQLWKEKDGQRDRDKVMTETHFIFKYKIRRAFIEPWRENSVII